MFSTRRKQTICQLERKGTRKVASSKQRSQRGKRQQQQVMLKGQTLNQTKPNDLSKRRFTPTSTAVHGLPRSCRRSPAAHPHPRRWAGHRSGHGFLKPREGNSRGPFGSRDAGDFLRDPGEYSSQTQILAKGRGKKIR